MIMAALLPCLLDLDVVYMGRRILSLWVLAGVLVGLGLLISAIHAIYVIKKWNDSLRQSISIELKDLEIRIEVYGRDDLIDVITEVEYLPRALGAQSL